MTPNRRRFTLGLAAFAGAGAAGSAPVTREPLTAEQDHRRLMDLLGIEQLRPGADGWTPGAPNPPNYDEARANPWPDLPDPLRFDDGRPVASAADWPERRAETAEHFEREIYGRVPATAPQVRWEASPATPGLSDGVRVSTRVLTGRLAGPEAPAVEAVLTVPAAATGPVPVVLALALPARFAERFPPEPGRPWKAQVIERGWGVAEYVPLSLQADDGAGLAGGVIGLAGGGRPRGLEDWGALRAWAWGASRILDALEALPETDAGRTAVFGVSRYGKAALVAMAFDPRFAAAFIASSGAGGAKLLRRDFGERVENLASSGLYHWMAGNFLKYAGPLDARGLPVDAHQLIALCAPRPVFVSVGSPEADNWTDPRGMFMAAAAAGPVYGLLGARPPGSEDFPSMGTLVDGDLAFRQHEGGHTGGPNWPVFLDWLAPRFS